MTAGKWRVQILNSDDQTISRLTRARDIALTLKLSGTPSLSFKLDIDDSQATDTILSTGVNDVEVFRNDVKIFRGRLWQKTKTYDGDNGEVRVDALGYFALLNKRLAGKTTDREFATIDAGTIAWTLISESQAETGGSLGITQGTIQTSVNRDRIYSYKRISEAITELADFDSGVDFEITPALVFNVYYPYQGVTNDNIVFRYPGAIERVEQIDQSGEIINYRIGLGRVYGDTEVTATDSDVDSILSYGRREDVSNYRDVGNVTTLGNMIAGDVARFKNLVAVYRITTNQDSSDFEWGDWGIGDSVAFKVNTAKWSLDKTLRILAVEFKVDDEGRETVIFTTGEVGAERVAGGASRPTEIPSVPSEIAQVENRLEKVETTTPLALGGVSTRQFVHNMVWTATDKDTASWSSGTIQFDSGTTYAISAGNTGDMAAKTYIYLDTSVSETVLQTSVTYSDCVGAGKALIAIAEPQAGAAEKCVITPIFSEGQTYSADEMVAGTLLAARLSVAVAYITNTAQIANLVVEEGNIANLAVTTGKIALLSVDTAQIANAAIETAKIAALAVTEAEIGNLAVTEGKIGNLAVTNVKVAADLSAAKITTGTLTLASGGVNLVAASGALTLNVGADVVLQASDSDAAEFKLVKATDATKYVTTFIRAGGAGFEYLYTTPSSAWADTAAYAIGGGPVGEDFRVIILQASDQMLFNKASSTYMNVGESGVTFYGAVSESALSADNVRIGVLAGSPRVIFENSGYTQYEIDVTTTSLRFLSPGLALYHMHSGAFFPEADETRNLGGASNAFNIVYYKVLSDQGCLFSADRGVELQSGKKVSDMEALRTIKTHPTKKSVQGLPMLDYRTMPKPVYMPSDFDTHGNPIPRDKDGNAYIMEEKIVKGKKKKVRREVSDGADFGALVSIMLGAIKEQDREIQEIKAQIKGAK